MGVGSHYLVDCLGVGAGPLRDESRLVAILRAALDAGGFRVLGTTSHRFLSGGCGVTGVFLLSESHLAFHSYPEHGYLALDLFSCGEARPEAALEVMRARLQPELMEIDVRERGSAVERVMNAGSVVG